MMRVLLLTGWPGVGKTTALLAAVSQLTGLNVAGFTTEEIRKPAGRRAGFLARSLGRDHAVTIACVDWPGPPRVGRYGVDLAAIDRLADEDLGVEDADLYVIDEIGKMECFSKRFVAAVRGLLEARRPVLATIALRGGGLIAEVKAHPDAEIWEMTAANRGSMPDRIAAWARSLERSGTRARASESTLNEKHRNDLSSGGQDGEDPGDA